MPRYCIPPYDIEVSFPFEAYDCQLIYMQRVILVLETKQNALLESPTGTGKTLCLLCACLAWREWKLNQERKKNGVDVDAIPAEPDWGEVRTTPDSGVPRIFYTSRTHSQLKQVIRELKKTPYRPSTAMMASREQLCLSSQVKKLKGSQQAVICDEYRKKDETGRCKCSFYNNFRIKSQKVPSISMMDIEDIVDACRTQGLCSYFKSRECALSADIVMCPYNYLIDPQLRKMQNIRLANAIIIFDEGHNIDKACEDAGSFELTTLHLDHCVKEIEDALGFLALDEGESYCESRNVTKDVLDLLLISLKGSLLSLQKEIFQLVLPQQTKGQEGASGELLLVADDLYTLFQRSTFSLDKYQVTKDTLEKTMSILNAGAASTGFGGDVTVKGQHLDELGRIFKTLFREDFVNDTTMLNKNYKIFVQEVEHKTRKRKKGMDWTETDEPDRKRVLSFWCFTSVVAMQNMIQEKCHSLIITSGTLSPMVETMATFGADFTVTLENAHVISKCQVFGGVVSKGPGNELLIGNYENRQNERYMRDLADAVTRVCKICPDGILVAFASYTQMDCILNLWRKTGQLRAIENYKDVFEEPRVTGDLAIVWQRYSNAVESVRGGVIFAVCRGKLTEGVDFSDRQCRAVIVCGMPFPPAMDAKVRLKKEFLDKQSNKKGDTAPGNIWYNQQAARAVNQTLGRVIRHRHDFGAVLLFDHRFSKPAKMRELSKWLTPSLQNFASFEDSMTKLEIFFRTIKVEGVPQNLVVKGDRQITIAPDQIIKEVSQPVLTQKKCSPDDWFGMAAVLLSSDPAGLKSLKAAAAEVQRVGRALKTESPSEEDEAAMRKAIDAIRYVLVPGINLEKKDKLPLNRFLVECYVNFLPKPYKKYWKESIASWIRQADPCFKPMLDTIFK